MERMSAVRRVDPVENVAEVEAGAILDVVRDAAEGAGREFPLALASGGSARIGGLLATNAGGVTVLRYGTARALCLGVEAVLADGRIYRGLSRLRKDNTGYDLRDLLIGSEGTLGVITAASLRLVPPPASVGTAMFAVTDPAAALALLARAQEMFGEGITAYELIHRQGLDFLTEVGPEVRLPFAQTPEWMVLIELGLTHDSSAESALEALFVEGAEQGWAQDGVIAQSSAQRHDLWSVRESIPDANRRIGAVVSHDISLPLSVVPEFIARAPGVIAGIGAFRINCFGHLGDGNLHYNLFPMPGVDRGAHDAQRADLSAAVHDLVHEMGGSFSAEHGVGRLKVGALERYGDPVGIDMMRAIKAALDPRGILNPGVILRDQSPE